MKRVAKILNEFLVVDYFRSTFVSPSEMFDRVLNTLLKTGYRNLVFEPIH